MPVPRATALSLPRRFLSKYFSLFVSAILPASSLSSVLLVDDDSTTNFLNKLLLTTTMQVTQQVLLAENGQQALQVLQQTCAEPAASCPPLILLDLNMPVMNGRAFLECYAQLPLAQRQGTVVVLLTTSARAGPPARPGAARCRLPDQAPDAGQGERVAGPPFSGGGSVVRSCFFLPTLVSGCFRSGW